jgi:hypothetical protein
MMDRNLEAEASYAAAWQQYCLTPQDDTVQRQALEEAMDQLQPQIATSPKDPRWPAFIDTLPGYKQFWEGWGAEMMQKAARKFA